VALWSVMAVLCVEMELRTCVGLLGGCGSSRVASRCLGALADGAGGSDVAHVRARAASG
jgi:hypothetical protein